MRSFQVLGLDRSGKNEELPGIRAGQEQLSDKRYE
jgi:hypothetical protein